MIGQAELFINYRMPHLNLFDNCLKAPLDLTNRTSRADLAAFHTQDTGFFPGDNIGRTMGGDAVFTIKEFDAAIGANLGTLAAIDASFQEVIFI